MAKRKGSSAPSSSRARKKVDNDAKDPESTERRLDKLPRDVWEKILDELEENDLFPLALSCRFFRQKQKELVERTRESGPESGEPALALKTNLMRKLNDGQPASVDYLRFCSKEEVSRYCVNVRDDRLRRLAAHHGHLSLLKELLKPLEMLDQDVIRAAGKTSFAQSLFLLCFGF